MLSSPIHTGNRVHVERARSQPDDSANQCRQHKRQLRADGPFRIMTDTSNSITIDKAALVKIVPRYRITKKPPLVTHRKTPDDDGSESSLSSRTRSLRVTNLESKTKRADNR